MNQQRWRIIVSIVAGLTVSLLALVTAPRRSGRLFQIPYEYALSSDSRILQDAVSTFRQLHGDLPTDLSQLGLRENKSTASQMRFDHVGRPLDPWGVPYVYRTVDQTYEIVTWAADQKPGGIGGDADVRVAPRKDDEFYILEPPTLRQYVFEYATAGAIATCVAAGVCTFLIGALQRGRDGKPAVGWTGLVLSLVVVGALSVFMAGVLAAAHLPFEYH